MTLLLRPRTIREQLAEDAFTRATASSIQAARQQQLTDRAEVTATTGVQFDPFRDGQLLPRTKEIA